MYRSNTEKAIHIGYIVLRLCSSIRATKIILPLLPLLLHSLLLGKHFNNAFSILQELEVFADEDSDSSGRTDSIEMTKILQLILKGRFGILLFAWVYNWKLVILSCLTTCARIFTRSKERVG